VDPRSSQVVLATTDVGLFRSADGGATFSHLRLPVAGTGFYFLWSLAFLGNDTWLVVGQVADITLPPGSVNAGSLGLWRSPDAGQPWTFAPSALRGGDLSPQRMGRVPPASAPSSLAAPASARVYLLAAKVDAWGQYDVLRSDDGGLHSQSLQVISGRPPLNP